MNRDRHIQEVKSATLLRFNDLWRQNFRANASVIQKNPGVLALKNKFRGVPGVVIGAGPSLDKNIRHLAEAQDKAVFIASDAALKPLLANRITPQIVACLDPQEDIARFFAGVPSRSMTLIAPSIIHPHVLALWEGDVVFYSKFAPDIPTLTEIQKRAPHLGCLTPGGTVLSIAYDVAFQSGANPILFVGQDLSWPKRKTHTRESDAASESMDLTLKRQQENIVMETGMHGQTLPTLKSMSVSKQWFNWAFTTWQREGGVTVINASEAGILTDHCSLMPLSEAIYKFCRKKINVGWALKKSLKYKNK